MCRASFLVLIVSLLVVGGCYYDQSDVKMSPAGTDNYITNAASMELATTPIKFKFNTDKDVVVEETAAEVVECAGVDCTLDKKVCDPVTDTCVPCYMDTSEISHGCGECEYCEVDAANPQVNECVEELVCP